MARMFGTDPRLLVKGLLPRDYLKMRGYYRYVSGYKPVEVLEGGVTIEHTGFVPEEDAVIVD